MNTVIIVGDCNADRFLEKFDIVKSSRFTGIKCENAAVILGGNASARIIAALGVIVDSETFCGKIPHGIQLIDCGLSQKSTVFITSRTEDKITVSLSRSIRTASGICDPLELPLPFSEGASDFDVMAAFAARILLR